MRVVLVEKPQMDGLMIKTTPCYKRFCCLTVTPSNLMNELNHRRVPPGAVPNGTVPPGATRSPSAASSHANNYSQRTLDALLSAPERESQPHLHPRKLNGALWFGIDPSVYKFVRTTWQSNFMGPWKNWSDVPEDRQEIWWHTFVQHYYWEARFHDIVYFLWKKETMTSIGDRISKKKGKNKKPKYIGETDWDFLMEYWDTEPAQKKSKSAAGCRMSDPLNKGIHKHCAGPRAFARIEYQMASMVESGLDEPPPFTDLVRRTHTRKDGTMDARSESLVLEVEEAAKQVMEEDDSLNDQTASSGGLPSRLVLNKEYLKRGKSKRGYIYGLGSVQYREINPSEKVAVAMSRNLDNEMRIYGLEKNNEALKETNEALKEDMVELKSGMGTVMDELAVTRLALNAIMQSLGVRLAPSDVVARAAAAAGLGCAGSTAGRDGPPVAASAAAASAGATSAAASPAVSPTDPPTRTQQGNLDAWCASAGL
ncbi:unnamed protein product [Arabidopsis arenosa]|uniref:Transposase, Ptta/En/Spm, plant n=1 Tax=Arabidopsis arenosa TaxID=38785 RepID=A0A8S1ZXL4_ARAAE|nr:unnamed protein product [Arabidopsis arenosa]